MAEIHPNLLDYIIPSDNWEQQRLREKQEMRLYYIIPSDNWEQQRTSVI